MAYTRRCVIIGLLHLGLVQRTNVLYNQIAIFLYVVIVYVYEVYKMIKERIWNNGVYWYLDNKRVTEDTVLRILQASCFTRNGK